METEVGMMHLQAEEGQGLSCRNTRSWKKGPGHFPSVPPKTTKLPTP